MKEGRMVGAILIGETDLEVSLGMVVEQSLHPCHVACSVFVV